MGGRSPTKVELQERLHGLLAGHSLEERPDPPLEKQVEVDESETDQEEEENHWIDG